MITRQTAAGRSPVSFPERATFELPLTTSVIPLAGFGSVTYTRATPATVTDHEGVIRDCIAGEARFQGARRVRNLHTYSEDITNAAWTSASCTKTKNAGIAPDGTNTAGLVTSAVATALTEFNQNYNIVSGKTYILSVYLKANGGLQYVQLVGNAATFGVGYINVDLSNGTITANVPGAANMQATVTPEANGFYRIQFKATAIATIANNHLSVAMIPSSSSIRTPLFPGDGIKGFYYWHPQFEDVTGQSVQTAAEYVSTNVLNAAPYHGANVDGVKYFKTNIAGLPISPDTLKGFLCEGARTNLFLQSNNFTTTWTKNAAQLVITSGAATGPDGATSMWKLSPGAGSALQSVTQSVTVTASVYTYSVYAKAGENTVLQLLTSGSISAGYVNFDLSNGTVGSSSLWTGSMEYVGNGIYRCVAITNTLVATTNSIHLSQVPTSTTGRAGNINGDGVSGLYVWGAQFELGTFASTYIPTTTATVARNVDALSYNVANVISNYGAAYFELTMGHVPTTGVDRCALQLSGNNNNRFQLSGTGVGSNISLLNVGNGSSVLSTNLGVTMATGTYSKIAGKWTNSGVANLFQNGSKSTDIASPQVIATQIDIGNAGSNPLYGFVKNLRLWKSPPTDAELIAITTL